LRSHCVEAYIYTKVVLAFDIENNMFGGSKLKPVYQGEI